MNAKKWALWLAAICGFGLHLANAQIAGAQTGTPLKIACKGQWNGSGIVNVSLTGGMVNPAYSSSGSCGCYITQSGTSNTPTGVIQVQAGTSCSLSITAPIPNTVASVTVSFAAQPGYTILINGVRQSSVTINNPSTTAFVLTVTVLAPGDFHGRAGDASSITSGQVYWQVALGGLLNGTSAGSLKLIDTGLESTWSSGSGGSGIFTTADLQYESPSAEVVVYKDSNSNIRQISAPQAFVDVVTTSASSYTINFYNPMEITVSGSTVPYTLTSNNSNSSPIPYVSYAVSQVGSANELQILCTTRQATTTITSSAVARVAATTLTRTGTSPNYTWVLDDWYTSGQSPQVEEKRVWGTNASGNPTENLTRYQYGAQSSTTALTVNNTFSTSSSTPWGQELSATSLGTTGTSPAVSYSYVPASMNGYGLMQNRAATDGSGAWTAYDYYGASSSDPIDGALYHIYKPFGNSPATPGPVTSTGEMTTLSYSLDPFGMPTRLWTSTTTINNVETQNQSTTYSDYNDTRWSGTGSNMVAATTTASVASGATVVSSLKYFRETYPDDFYTGQVYSATRPDGVIACSSYQRGTLSFPSGQADSFTASTTGTASCVAVINGSALSASGGTAATTFTVTGGLIDTVYLVSGESTATVILRDAQALVRSVQNYAWYSGGWALVGYVNYTYDTAGQLNGTVAMNGATTADAFTGDQHTSHSDETGVVVHYTYDYSGRLQTTYKTSGPVTTYAYDAAGRLLSTTLKGSDGSSIVDSCTYDDAERLTTHTPAGLGVVQLSYFYGSAAGGIVGSAAVVTQSTYPDASVRNDAITADGRPLATTGTAVVATGYTYVPDPSTGYFDITTTIGGSGSARLQTVATDMMGRTVTVTRPGFANNGVSQPSYQESYGYDSKSHLTEVDRTGLAPIKYLYDVMGQVYRAGIDSSGDNLGSGPSSPSTVDRMVDQKQYVEYYNSAYWLHQEIDAYATPGSTTAFQVSISRQRLTGFGSGQLAETDTTDAYGNVTGVTVNSPGNTGTATVTSTTTTPANPTAHMYTATETFINGLKDHVVGVDGFKIQYGYDFLERPTTVTDPRTNQTTTSYVPGTAEVLNVEDASGAYVATYGYDTLGRVNSMTDASRNTTHYGYTSAGQLQDVWGTGSCPVSYGYSPEGDCTSQTTYRTGTFTGSTWPSNPTGGDETQWAYDAGSGLLASKTDPASATVKYTYDSSYRPQTRVWARGTTTTYTYDANKIGDLYQVTYSDGTPQLTFTYTRAGEMSTITDYAGTRNVNYSNTSQPLELSSVALPSFYNSLVQTRLYNSDGLLPGRPTGFSLGTSTSNPATALSQSYAYNTLGQFLSVTSGANHNANQAKFTYGYETNASLVQSLTDGGNYKVNYQYDSARNLVTEVQTQWGSGATSTLAQFDYVYNALGQRQSTQQSGLAFKDYYNGVSGYSSVYNYYQYDSYGQLNMANMYTGTAPAAGSGPTTSPLPGRYFGYQYDDQGNRLQAGPGQAPNVANDAYYASSGSTAGANSLNQYYSKDTNTERIIGNAALGSTVTSNVASIGTTDRNFGGLVVPAPTSTTQASYDSVNVYAYNNGYDANTNVNYLLPPQPQLLAYDADGNLDSDGVWVYTYDAENRVTTMTNTKSVGVGQLPNSIAFNYDYLGRRIEKIVSGGPNPYDHRYLYDGWNLVAEMDTSGNILRSYTWGLDISQDLDATGGVGALLEITNSPETSSVTNYYTAMDANGNVVALVNATSGSSNLGQLAAVYEYSPFGEPLRAESPNSSDTAVQDNPFRFSTKFTDLESKMVNYGLRLYDPSLGRFNRRDPIEEAGGQNLYGFCGNDGINGVDYLGMGMNPPVQASEISWTPKPVNPGNVSDGTIWNFKLDGTKVQDNIVDGKVEITGAVLNGKLFGNVYIIFTGNTGLKASDFSVSVTSGGLLDISVDGYTLYDSYDSGAGPAPPVQSGGGGSHSGSNPVTNPVTNPVSNPVSNPIYSTGPSNSYGSRNVIATRAGSGAPNNASSIGTNPGGSLINGIVYISSNSTLEALARQQVASIENTPSVARDHLNALLQANHGIWISPQDESTIGYETNYSASGFTSMENDAMGQWEGTVDIHYDPRYVEITDTGSGANYRFVHTGEPGIPLLAHEIEQAYQIVTLAGTGQMTSTAQADRVENQILYLEHAKYLKRVPGAFKYIPKPKP